MEHCLLCGKEFGESKFIVQFQKSKIHVCCEQNALNEPWIERIKGTKEIIIYEFGIR